jgi:hypothetical protein
MCVIFVHCVSSDIWKVKRRRRESKINKTSNEACCRKKPYERTVDAIRDFMASI